ncbi:MAG: LysE family transporter [Armatimonadota bacterium]|nr:LysE family transporter [Armatimonadota bacterium]
MSLGFLVRGLVIGLSIAAPVGPIGVLCIRRSLAQGRAAGFVSGLGAATADAVYGAVAGLGLTFLSWFLVSQQTWLRLAGGAFLLCLGARTFLTHPSGQAAGADGRGLLGAYASTFFLTLTNPMTILSFAAIFAGLGLARATDRCGSTAALVTGVFLGSAAWWLILSGAAAAFRGSFTPGGLRWVNRVSGVVITLFGFAAIASLFGQ